MTMDSEHDVRVGDPRVSQSIAGIQGSSLLEVFKPLLLALCGSLAPIEPCDRSPKSNSA